MSVFRKESVINAVDLAESTQVRHRAEVRLLPVCFAEGGELSEVESGEVLSHGLGSFWLLFTGVQEYSAGIANPLELSLGFFSETVNDLNETSVEPVKVVHSAAYITRANLLAALFAELVRSQVAEGTLHEGRKRPVFSEVSVVSVFSGSGSGHAVPFVQRRLDCSRYLLSRRNRGIV